MSRGAPAGCAGELESWRRCRRQRRSPGPSSSPGRCRSGPVRPPPAVQTPPCGSRRNSVGWRCRQRVRLERRDRRRRAAGGARCTPAPPGRDAPPAARSGRRRSGSGPRGRDGHPAECPPGTRRPRPGCVRSRTGTAGPGASTPALRRLPSDSVMTTSSAPRRRAAHMPCEAIISMAASTVHS